MDIILKQTLYLDEYKVGELLWSGAKDRWEDYTDLQKLQLIDFWNQAMPGGSDLQDFNDFIWFDADDILEQIKNLK